MTRSCCPTCRLRFSAATAAQLGACPFCGHPVQTAPAPDVLGFRLLAVDALVALDAAVAQAAPPERDRRV